MRYVLFTALLIMTFSVHFPAQAQMIKEDRTAVRIMAYYGVGQDDAPATSVTLKQFKAHLRELNIGNYNVVALPDVLHAYKKKAPLPDNSIVLTFDGSDKSILTQAAPLLKKYQFPFTVFLSPERVMGNNARYLTLKDIKKLQKLQLVNFGIHPENYSEEGFEDIETLRSNINSSVSFYRDLFQEHPQYLAFPQGLYSKTHLDIAHNYGFKALLGQQSGVAYHNPKGTILPRFLMTENYADQRRFKMTANALPIPASEQTPVTSIIKLDNPAIGFTTSEDLDLKKLSCYATGQSKPTIETLNNRIEIRLQQNIDDLRFRVNCTLPVKNDEIDTPKRWRWFGLLLSVN